VVETAGDEAVLLPDGSGRPFAFGPWVRVAAEGALAEVRLSPPIRKVWKTDLFLGTANDLHYAATRSSRAPAVTGRCRRARPRGDRRAPPACGRRLARVRATTAAWLSLVLTCAAWLALLVGILGGDWRLVFVFLLLGLTGYLVGLAACLVERTPVALFAAATGTVAPVASTSPRAPATG
jgi:hypothetical protein